MSPVRAVGAAGLALCLALPLAACTSNHCTGSATCGNENSRVEAPTGGPSSASAPFTFTVEQVDPWDACAGGRGKVYLRAPDRSEVAAQLDARQLTTSAEREEQQRARAAFDRQHDAVPADYSVITLTLRGTGSAAVTISSVTPEVTEQKPVPPEALRIAPVGACGNSNLSSFLVDLDRERPALVFKEGEDADGRKRVRGFPVQVTQSDPEVLTLIPLTTGGLHSFAFVVHWSDGSALGTTRVTATDGKPFTVASGNGAHQYDYLMQGGVFTEPTFRMNPADPLGEPLPLTPAP
ncbi:hypothetical protein ACIRBX_26085 [Kitasatospora sp. NPDC096147]|uniref:hypothetical protein n=1 Tax=Kitasatospora sp. NPDC096147 TaxID=3364093 RepID=UPI003805C9B3